jgi:hypothetical protein
MAAAFHETIEIGQDKTTHVGRLGMATCAFGLEDGRHLFGKADWLSPVQAVIIFGFLSCVLGVYQEGKHKHTTKTPRTQRTESKGKEGFTMGSVTCTGFSHRRCFLFHQASQSHLRDLYVFVVHFFDSSMVEEKLSTCHDGPGDIMKGFSLRLWLAASGCRPDGFQNFFQFLFGRIATESR